MAEPLGDMRRTHHCRELGSKNVGDEVKIMGWVQRRRDHGGVIFIDLRDRNGITQVVFNPEHNQAVHEKAHEIRSEYVLAVKGIVGNRPDGMTNPDLVTGEIEVMVNELKILNLTVPCPFPRFQKSTSRPSNFVFVQGFQIPR